MLVTVTIMLILVTATVTMFRPANEERRIREAARAINVYLGSARNRAMETGRPCGVTFRNFGTPGFAMNADQCEVPPCYAGYSETSTATVTKVNSTTLSAVINEIIGDDKLAATGDLVQLNLQGFYYKITGKTVDSGVGTTTLTLTLDTSLSGGVTTIISPWTTTGQSVPFRIYRAPVKGYAQPLQLPAASVIDLQSSSYETTMVNNNDFTVLFSPNGSVDCVYVSATRYPVTEPIYLLVGKRERVGNPVTPNNPNESTLTNWQDLNNIWIVINPQTGVVTSDVIAPMITDTSDPNYVDPADSDYESKAIRNSRRLARESQGIGGR